MSGTEMKEGGTMGRYLIYRGAEDGVYAGRTGIVVRTDVEPDDAGIVVLSEDEYESSMESSTPTDMGLEDYDVTTGYGRAVLHPVEIAFDDPAVDLALRAEED